MKLDRPMVVTIIGLMVFVLLCVIALKWTGDRASGGGGSQERDQPDAYAQCVQKALMLKDTGNATDKIEVAAALKNFLSLGPKQERAKSWQRVQQYVRSDEQRTMLNHCAQAAGMTAPLRYVVVEVSPRRRDVTIVQLGAAATSCVTAASGICPLPVIEPEQPVRLTIQSAAYEAPTRLVERSELDAGYLQLPIKVRGEMLLTIVASEATHPFLGWIAVESTFDDPEGELTSQDCFRDYRWEENECRSARADADGRVEFRYTKKLKDLKISLKDYRSAVAVWSGAPGSDRIDVAWPTSPNAKVDRDQPPAFPRQLPCGSRSSVESLLAHAAWPSTGEYSITMMIDAQGFISALDGAPDEVASHLKPRRIGVVANCKPTQWRLSYRARAE